MPRLWRRPGSGCFACEESEAKLSYVDQETWLSRVAWKLELQAPIIIAVVCALLYFGTRFYTQLDISAPLKTCEGLYQREQAAQKYERYHDWMDTRVRRGGGLKGVLFWPIAPTSAIVSGPACGAGALPPEQLTIATTTNKPTIFFFIFIL